MRPMRKKKARPPKDASPEWTAETSARAVRLKELPPSLQAKIRSRGQRGPQKTPTKVQTAIRYYADVIEHFKAGGPGWQTRMSEALKRAIEAELA